jgi:hypothetical protein
MVEKQRFEWRGAKCDIVDDGGVFIKEGWVVAYDPHEIVLDNQLGEAHVGLCILYCLEIVSTLMTIWRWSLAQTIIDMYALRKHLITFNETHILDDEDVGIVGVKKKKFIRGSTLC